ncbi:hypothetical protein QOZ80_5AG0376250 [Eleusine coracana subsp. coracana]|nr:hypothetical protein QOZ80_5AG0376250 [Eleusine coracana subsp. coracana]
MGYHDGILEFDLERQHLAIIHKPEGAHYTNITSNWVLRTEDGELGLAKLSTVNIQLWGRKAISNGAVGWVLQKTIELDKLLSLTTSLMLAWATRIVGYDEDSNVIFLLVWDIVFTIQLESMQFKKVSEDSLLTRYHTYYPYRSF